MQIILEHCYFVISILMFIIHKLDKIFINNLMNNGKEI